MPLNRISVVCMNPECTYFQQTRTVGLIHLGQDVFQHPTLVCGCSLRQPLALRPDDEQPQELPGDIVADE